MKIEILGFIAGLFSTGSFAPQVWKTVKTKDTEAMSLIYLAMVMIGIALWLVYGTLKNDMTIVVANAVVAVFVSIIFYIKLKNVLTGKEKI